MTMSLLKLPTSEPEPKHPVDQAAFEKLVKSGEEIDQTTGKKKESGMAHAFALLLGQIAQPAHEATPIGTAQSGHTTPSVKLTNDIQPAEKAPTSELRAKAPEAETKAPADNPPPAVPASPAPLLERSAAVAAPVVAAVRAPLPPPAMPVQGTIQAQSAHLNLDVGNAGELALHLRMKDGVADVRLNGSATSVLRAREPELRLALTSSGVAVNHIDIGPAPVGAARDMGTSTSSDAFAGESQSGQSQREDDAPAPGTIIAQATTSTAGSSGPSALHVKA